MALIKHGGLVAEIRGSIAGSTYARNRSGAYVRNRTKPINPATASQILVRVALTYLQTYWMQTLTDTQRQAWNDFALQAKMKNRLGEAIALTGFNQFQRVNYYKKVTGSTILQAPPPLPVESTPPGLTISATTALGLQITAVSPDLLADEILQYRWTPPMSTGVNFFKGPFAFKDYQVGVAAPPWTLDATVAIGDRYHVDWRFVDTVGRVSFTRQAIVDCTA